MGRNKQFVGVEIGTAKVVVLIAETRGDGLARVLGVGESVSRGVRKGEIVDLDKITLCLNEAVAEAEEKADCTVSEVVVSVTGAHLVSLSNRGAVTIPEDRDEIEEEDLAEVEDSALDVNIPAGHVFLHRMIQHYYVDGQEGVISPLGMLGRRLEAEYHIIHGIKTRVQNTLRCVKQANLEPENVVVSSVAASQALLDMPMKEAGALVIDIGAGTSDYILYRGGAVRGSGVLSVGGDHITHDISIGLRIPSKQAERLKCEHADVTPGATSQRGLIDLEDKTLASMQVERRSLNTIAEVRVREMLSIIKNRSRFSEHEPYMAGGVLLTGGTSQLKGLSRLAADVFGTTCKVAAAQPIAGPSILSEDPRYSTAIGLILYAQAAQASMDQSTIFDKIKSRFGRFIPGL